MIFSIRFSIRFSINWSNRFKQEVTCGDFMFKLKVSETLISTIAVLPSSYNSKFNVSWLFPNSIWEDSQWKSNFWAEMHKEVSNFWCQNFDNFFFNLWGNMLILEFGMWGLFKKNYVQHMSQYVVVMIFINDFIQEEGRGSRLCHYLWKCK